MSNETEKPWPLLGIIAAGFGLVAFLAMILIGDYRFMPALILGAIIGLLVALFLFLAFLWGRDESDYAHEGSGSGSGSTGTASGATGAATGAAGTAAAATASAASRTADAGASAASTATGAVSGAASSAGSTASDAASSAASGASDAASSAGDAASDMAASASDTASGAATTASTAASSASSNMGADYDGDGIYEGADEGVKPATMNAPKDGIADDLKKIKGVGPKLEALLNRLGFFHFEQVASWSGDEVAWVDANLEGFKGRVSRDNWVEQAAVLARGGETEFSKKVDDGDVY
jgi:predicted flap endonuclease-1-like 5' DNA nuclease